MEARESPQAALLWPLLLLLLAEALEGLLEEEARRELLPLLPMPLSQARARMTAPTALATPSFTWESSLSMSCRLCLRLRKYSWASGGGARSLPAAAAAERCSSAWLAS